MINFNFQIPQSYSTIRPTFNLSPSVMGTAQQNPFKLTSLTDNITKQSNIDLAKQQVKNTTGNTIAAQSLSALGSQLGSFMQSAFGDEEAGQVAGSLVGSAVGTTFSKMGDNLLKGISLQEGLAQDVGASVAGAGAGIAGNYIGKGINSLGGNSRLSRGLGAATASGIGSFGGMMASNAIKGQALFNGLSSGSLAGMVGNAVGTGLSAAFGPSREYNGRYGKITKGMDMAYNGLQAAIGFVPGWGQLASGAMALNKGLSNIFGSTDGMCVCAGTKVYTADGRYINIEDLKQEDGILGWNEKTHEIRPQKIECLIEPRYKECVEIKLDNGRKLKCSIDHPILSNIKEKAESHRINGQRIAYREWEFRRADELKEGNWVGLANDIDYWGIKEISNAYLVGMLIGDGTYTYENSCKLWTADPSTWKYLEENNLAELIKQYTPENSNGKYSIENRDYRIVNGMQLVKDLGIAYQKGTEKTLPKNIDQYNKDSICKLIAGLFDTDGSFSGNKEKGTFSLTLYQSNLNLLKEVQHLLYKLGIVSNINTRKASINKMKNGKIINSNTSYRLEVTDRRSILKFKELIPINIDYKKANLNIICEIVFPKKDKDHYELSGARQAKIISITKIGIQTVYNLEVTDDHTYLANDIITHNTVQDAILGSAFMPAPVKWLNMAGARTTEGFKNQSWQNTEKTNSFMQNAYGNLQDRFDKAREEGGRTYGTFSRKAYKKAQANVSHANDIWDQILALADQNELQNIRSQYMTSINNQRYAQNIQGGFSPLARGKQGMKILNNATNHNIGQRLLSAAALIDSKQMILSAQ